MSNEIFSEQQIKNSRTFAYFEWLADDAKKDGDLTPNLEAVQSLKKLLSENSQPSKVISDLKQESPNFATQIANLAEIESISKSHPVRAQGLLVSVAKNEKITNFINNYKKDHPEIELLNHADKALQQVFFSSQPKLKAEQSLMSWVALVGLGMGGFVYGAPNQAADVANYMTQRFTGNPGIAFNVGLGALVFVTFLIGAAYSYYKRKELESAIHVLQETPGYEAITKKFNDAYSDEKSINYQKNNDLMLQALKAEAYCLRSIKDKMGSKFPYTISNVVRQDFVNRVCQFVLKNTEQNPIKNWEQIHEAFNLLNTNLHDLWGGRNRSHQRYSLDPHSNVITQDPYALDSAETVSLLGKYLCYKQEGWSSKLHEEIIELKRQRVSSLKNMHSLETTIENFKLEKNQLESKTLSLSKGDEKKSSQPTTLAQFVSEQADGDYEKALELLTSKRKQMHDEIAETKPVSETTQAIIKLRYINADLGEVQKLLENPTVVEPSDTKEGGNHKETLKSLIDKLESNKTHLAAQSESATIFNNLGKLIEKLKTLDLDDKTQDHGDIVKEIKELIDLTNKTKRDLNNDCYEKHFKQKLAPWDANIKNMKNLQNNVRNILRTEQELSEQKKAHIKIGTDIRDREYSIESNKSKNNPDMEKVKTALINHLVAEYGYGNVGKSQTLTTSAPG